MFENKISRGVKPRLKFALRPALAALLFMCLLLVSCQKVGLSPIGASFGLAQSTWFEIEKTLFLFYELSSEQDLGPESLIEFRVRTLKGTSLWQEVPKNANVHKHLFVDCGLKKKCGSASVGWTEKPIEVELRLRYHRDGALGFNELTQYYFVGSGPLNISSSYLIYGVFNEKNSAIQWRGRHNFPGLDNLRVAQLGLLRTFEIENAVTGDLPDPNAAVSKTNPYLFGSNLNCGGFVNLGSPKLTASKRAKFDLLEVAQEHREDDLVCADAKIPTYKSSISTKAFARRNAQTRPAFAALQSPVAANKPLEFTLRPCTQEISKEHLSMQQQRLLFSAAKEICTDGLSSSQIGTALSGQLANEVSDKRRQGQDMVAVLALHQAKFSASDFEAIQTALVNAIDAEEDKSSPRLTGAFVFDSDDRAKLTSSSENKVLWCPARATDPVPPNRPKPKPNESQKRCVVQTTATTLATLGPFSLGAIPIFPTRETYLDFLENYSRDQAGKMNTLTFLAPLQTPETQVVKIKNTPKKVTFRNGEIFSAKPEDAFSYCAPKNQDDNLLFRYDPNDPPRPLATLPLAHIAQPNTNYELGLSWSFPFLTRLSYQTSLAGKATAFGASIPFGLNNSSEEFYGEQNWLRQNYDLSKTLVQCEENCAFPAFDSAGVYNVRKAWKDLYASVCHEPVFPEGALGQESDPYDP